MLVTEAPPERGGASRVRLALGVDLLAEGGDLLLVRDGTCATHRLRAPGAGEREVLRRLAEGFTTRTALEADVAPALVAGVLEALAGARALEWRLDPARSPLGAKDAERFDRQLPYLAELDGSRRAEDVQRRLLDAHVTILGCGGLGSWTAQALLCAGVRRLRLIDPDRVELSNLNRQPLYGERDIGRPKVEAARDALLRIDAAARVEPVRERVGTEDEALRWLRGTELLVNTADWPPYELEHLVDRACLRLGLPHLTAGQQPPLVRVGPLSIPGRTPCHACSERALERRFERYASLKAARMATARPATTLGPASGLIGTLIASEVMHALIGAMPPATAGRAVLIDLRTLTSRAVPVTGEGACRGCQP
jgi:bacteriocin biosynthesis cyclodehydratase domain-containing protein